MKEKRKCRYPFTEYYTKEPSFHTGIQRYQILLYPYDTSKSPTTVPYARYLYSVAHKMKLSSDTQVDHIDGDRTCDLLSNLQILPANANKKKFITDNGIAPNVAQLRCPECDIVFFKKKSQTHLSKGGSYTSCSRECSGTIGQALQKKVHHKYSMDELNARIKHNVINVQKNYNGGHVIIPEKHQLEDWTLFTDDYPESVKEPKKLKYCAVCGKQLTGSQTKTCSLICNAEYIKTKRTFDIPLQDELNEMLLTMSPETIGKTYGVSGNAVRKWIKKYKNKIDNITE